MDATKIPKNKTFKEALKLTIPMLSSYPLMGIAYGIFMSTMGYNVIWTLLSSVFIYAGAMQFVMVDLLLNQTFLLEVFLITFMVNARHLFYGITMLEPFKNFGYQKIYQSLTLNDETFMLFVSLDQNEQSDKKRLYLYIALLNHSYWIIGSLIGGIFGDLVNIPSQGIEFVMTALYIVLFVDRLENEETHISSYIGVIASLLCLSIFGSDNFIIPTMIVMLVVFLLFKASIMKRYKSTELVNQREETV